MVSKLEQLEQRGRHLNQLALLGTRWYAPAELDMSNQSDVDRDISAFLAGAPFAVAGASASREKYGNIVLRRYWQAGRVAYPVNPTATSIEGAPCFPNLSALPEPVHAVSIVTPPGMSAAIVDEALRLGIKYLWFQPGAENETAIEQARAAGAHVIAHGPCVLVALGRALLQGVS